MSLAAGPYAIAAALLVLGGISKALHPGDTARALRGAGMSVPDAGVRVGGAVEVIVGTAALVWGDRLSAILVAISYLAFAGFVATALARRLPIATCGCFGRTDSPPTVTHLVLDLAAAIAAVAVAVDPGVGLVDVLGDQPLVGIPYLLLVVTGTACAGVALTWLPRTMVLVREGRAS
jgi:uncharacterized protein YjeT (DUF2065 family)